MGHNMEKVVTLRREGKSIPFPVFYWVTLNNTWYALTGSSLNQVRQKKLSYTDGLSSQRVWIVYVAVSHIRITCANCHLTNSLEKKKANLYLEPGEIAQGLRALTAHAEEFCPFWSTDIRQLQSSYIFNSRVMATSSGLCRDCTHAVHIQTGRHIDIQVNKNKI